jgi:Fic family protein
MSAQIRRERNAYHGMLEETQKGSLDVTPWLEWFLDCLGRAIDDAQTNLAAVLANPRFWENAVAFPLNERRRLVVNCPAGWLRRQAHDL